MIIMGALHARSGGAIDEQAAGFMAAIVGRLTGKPAACLSTLGPGATNFSTAAAYAHLGGFPMVILTGQKPIRHSKQGHFQIVDIVEHFKPITKFTKQIAEATAVPYLVRDCVRVSTEEKPGPVHLELPEDIAALPVADGTHLFPPHPIRRPVPDEKAVDNAIALLKAAKRPLLCIAAGANRKRVQNMMSQFVDKLGIFAVSTQMGKGVLPERHPQHIGCTALSANDIVHVPVAWSKALAGNGGAGAPVIAAKRAHRQLTIEGARIFRRPVQHGIGFIKAASGQINTPGPECTGGAGPA